MMDALQAIENRRSVRSYDANFIIPQSDFNRLLEIIRYTPTSFHTQGWRLLHVQDKEKRLLIEKASWGQKQVTEASALLIICADLKAWAKDTARYCEGIPDDIKDNYIQTIHSFYHNNPILERDEAVRSGSLMAQTLMIAASGMGYDTCPMVGFDPKVVSDVINLPKDYIIVMMITLGKRLQNPKPRLGLLSVDEQIFKDTF